MALTTKTGSAFKLKLNTGADDKDNAVYSSKSFKDVNAALSDDDVLEVANKLASLQTSPLAEVTRIDTTALTAK